MILWIEIVPEITTKLRCIDHPYLGVGKPEAYHVQAKPGTGSRTPHSSNGLEAVFLPEASSQGHDHNLFGGRFIARNWHLLTERLSYCAGVSTAAHQRQYHRRD